MNRISVDADRKLYIIERQGTQWAVGFDELENSLKDLQGYFGKYLGPPAEFVALAPVAPIGTPERYAQYEKMLQILEMNGGSQYQGRLPVPGKPPSALNAAASDLLEAAQLVMNAFAYAPGRGPEWYEATRAAVAKATEAGVTVAAPTE